MKVFDTYGNEMLEASSLERRGDDLVMKGRVMGSMPTTMYIRPEEIWVMRKLLSWSVIWYLPVIIVKGWLRARKLRPQKSEE